MVETQEEQVLEQAGTAAASPQPIPPAASTVLFGTAGPTSPSTTSTKRTGERGKQTLEEANVGDTNLTYVRYAHAN
jgi:hypothetical protein